MQSLRAERLPQGNHLHGRHWRVRRLRCCRQTAPAAKACPPSLTTDRRILSSSSSPNLLVLESVRAYSNIVKPALRDDKSRETREGQTRIGHESTKSR